MERISSKKNPWIVGGYYIDFDGLGQLRVFGPNNHFFCGLVDIPPHKIEIETIKNINNHLEITGEFLSNKTNLYYPVMDDVRTLREFLRGIDTFLQLRYRFIGRAFPRIVRKVEEKKLTKLVFKRNYGDNKFYETDFLFANKIEIKKISNPLLGFELKTKKTKKVPFTIICKTNEIHNKNFKHYFTESVKEFDFSVFGKNKNNVKNFVNQTEKEIIHLISWGKTSGDRFGTIFPRDWMESAVIGIHDLNPDVIDYMYQASLQNVNEKGEGWHEDVVGEYKYENEVSGKDIYNRKMIDIEPNYIIGLNYLPESFLANEDNNLKMRKVARYVLKEARKDFITFKKLPKGEQIKEEKYYFCGNWRDSEWAFKKIGSVIAPFDVNCVFYPAALITIKKFQQKLKLENYSKEINKLIKKWQKKKEYYRFLNKDGKNAYSLALYKIKNENSFKKMEVNNLDEAYLFTYLDGEQKEIKSFCERLLSKEYFYTPSGPTIIARNNEYGYTNQEYHGIVIWTKQTAFCVLGLSRHLKIALSENWPKPLQKLIKKTLLKICEDAIRTFTSLKSIPEVHYDEKGSPIFFNVQQKEHYRMSKVQLWSAIGARRIFRKYYELKTDPIYKNI